MVKAIFAGSFDPPTFGHMNIIQRASALFEETHVVIAVNKNKKYLFSAEERLEMLDELVKDLKNVSVHLCNSLIVDYAKKENASVLIRGVRNVADFSYELDLSLMNKGLSPNMETIFIPTDPKYLVLKSSSIKEVASFGGDISSMVPKIVADKVYEKLSMTKTQIL